jgi:hypothetical protein
LQHRVSGAYQPIASKTPRPDQTCCEPIGSPSGGREGAPFQHVHRTKTATPDSAFSTSMAFAATTAGLADGDAIAAAVTVTGASAAAAPAAVAFAAAQLQVLPRYCFCTRCCCRLNCRRCLCYRSRCCCRPGLSRSRCCSRLRDWFPAHKRAKLQSELPPEATQLLAILGQ